jgi:four helix bundle protein
MKESPIFSRTYDLLRWVIPVTIKFPRQQRFVLAESVQRTALALHEQLIEAAFSDDPLPVLKQADLSLAKLRFYLRLCRDLELISMDQFSHVARMISEIGRLLGGWTKTQAARSSGFSR